MPSSDKAAPSTVSVVSRVVCLLRVFYPRVLRSACGVFHDDYGIGSCFRVFCTIRESVVYIWGNGKQAKEANYSDHEH